ncbi:MAG: adenosine deaminase, partial [Gemmatimonadetes bacterium]|nr:adenosine deaminase [Gemmatimonadota bacterium]
MPKRTKRLYNQADEWKQFSTSYLKRFPKADLHVHLDGSIRVNTLWQLAKTQGVKLGASSAQALKKKVVVDAKVKNLGDYLKSFDITLRVLQTFDALARVAYELAEDAAKENVRYMEVRYSPLLHLANGLTIQDTVDAVLTGLHKAEAKYRIKTGIILCGMRHLSAKRSLELADAAVAYMGEGVVAFDLAGQEKDYPAKKHKEAFYRVLNANQNVTVHAGEAFGPASIHQAIHY